MSVEVDYLRKLNKEELYKLGNSLGSNFNHWNDVFDIMSLCRNHDLPEVYVFCILSDHFDITPKNDALVKSMDNSL